MNANHSHSKFELLCAQAQIKNARNFILAFFICACLCLSHALLSMQPHEEIGVNLAKRIFADIPSLNSVIKNCLSENQWQRKGALFELQVALYMQYTKQEQVEAFNVQEIPRDDLFPHVEYDCITTHYAIEAKSHTTISMKRAAKKIILQLKKELHLLWLLKIAHKGIKQGRILPKTSIGKKEKIWLELTDCKNNTPSIWLTSPSIKNVSNLEKSKQEWLDLIASLEQKKLLFISKNPIPGNLKRGLGELGIDYLENIPHPMRRASI